MNVNADSEDSAKLPRFHGGTRLSLFSTRAVALLSCNRKARPDRERSPGLTRTINYSPSGFWTGSQPTIIVGGQRRDR